MALETGSTIFDLKQENPTAADLIKEGDDHIRLIKKVLKTTFANLRGPLTITDGKLNLFDSLFNLTASLITFKKGISATAPANSADNSNTWDLKGNQLMNVGSAATSATITDPANDRRAASIADIVKFSRNAAWPVGSIILNFGENPQTTIGGAWRQISQGRALFGVGNAGEAIGVRGTGGTATTTLQTPHMPAHTHGPGSLTGTATTAGGHRHRFLGDDGVGAFNQKAQYWNYDAKSHGGDGGVYYTTTDGDHSHPVVFGGATSSVGSNQAFTNMPPYYGIFVWERTA